MDALKEYLRTMLSSEVEVASLGTADLAKAGWLVSFYDLNWLAIADRKYLLAKGKVGVRLSPVKVQKQLGRVNDLFDVEAVYVPTGLAPHDIPRLIASRIPFVAPEKGLFLPDFGLAMKQPLRERQVTRTTFSVPAQLLCIGRLLGKVESRVSIADVARATGFSNGSIVHALQELDHFAVGERIRQDGGRSMVFAFRPCAEIWELNRRRFFNPCKRVVGVLTPPADAVVAGVDALAKITALNEEVPTCYAVPMRGYASRGIEEYAPDADHVHLQLWHYAPAFFGDGAIDRFSLALTLRDEPDDRVQIELEKLERGMKW